MGADLERVRRITAQLEGLARDGKLTMTKYLELSMQAAHAADDE